MLYFLFFQIQKTFLELFWSLHIEAEMRRGKVHSSLNRQTDSLVTSQIEA